MARGDLFYEAWAESPRADSYKTDAQRRHCIAARWRREDTSWKVQYLDLSRITEGVIVRDDRFGYVSLAADPKAHSKDFIAVERLGGRMEVRFRVELAFDLETGAAEAKGYGAIHHEGEGYRPSVWINGRPLEK